MTTFWSVELSRVTALASPEGSALKGDKPMWAFSDESERPGFDRQLHPTYDHRPRHSEPLLWAADAACWAAGAGSEWQQRLVGILTVRGIAP